MPVHDLGNRAKKPREQRDEGKRGKVRLEQHDISKSESSKQGKGIDGGELAIIAAGKSEEVLTKGRGSDRGVSNKNKGERKSLFLMAGRKPYGVQAGCGRERTIGGTKRVMKTENIGNAASAEFLAREKGELGRGAGGGARAANI